MYVTTEANIEAAHMSITNMVFFPELLSYLSLEHLPLLETLFLQVQSSSPSYSVESAKIKLSSSTRIWQVFFYLVNHMHLGFVLFTLKL